MILFATTHEIEFMRIAGTSKPVALIGIMIALPKAGSRDSGIRWTFYSRLTQRRSWPRHGEI